MVRRWALLVHSKDRVGFSMLKRGLSILSSSAVFVLSMMVPLIVPLHVWTMHQSSQRVVREKTRQQIAAEGVRNKTACEPPVFRVGIRISSSSSTLMHYTIYITFSLQPFTFVCALSKCVIYHRGWICLSSLLYYLRCLCQIRKRDTRWLDDASRIEARFDGFRISRYVSFQSKITLASSSFSLLLVRPSVMASS